MTYLHRTIEPKLLEALQNFPAVVLNGPRQAGKTTLLRHLLGDSHRYVSLEVPSHRAAANTDPAAFLQLHPPPVILDEVHHAPVLLHYVKDRIDEDRSRAGQWVLTGSQNLLMLEKVTETLAGRAAILTLLPLSLREIAGEASRSLVWEDRSSGGARTLNHDAAGFGDAAGMWSVLLKGGYPELWVKQHRDIALWHESYILTYLERDVRSVRAIGDLSRFREFMKMLALRHGQLLNLTELGRDLGLSGQTCKAWLSVLEAGHQVLILRPWYGNPSKRLMKSPKVYFTDSGTLCALCGIEEPGHLMRGPMAGAVFEGAMVIELAKAMLGRGRQPHMWFWRTSHGEEVDVLVEGVWRDESGEPQKGLIPLEAKAAATIRPEHFRGIQALRRTMAVAEASKTGAPVQWPLHPGLVVSMDHTGMVPGCIGLGQL